MQISKSVAKGLRPYQEDRHLVLEYPYGTLVAVMDGHGGEGVSQKLENIIPNEWPKYVAPRKPVEHAMEEFFARLHQRTQMAGDGATMTAVFTDGQKATVAVLGDSPVVIKTTDGSIYVGPMHNARSNPSERDAAQAKGAIYFNGYIGDHFSNGGLQMTRVFGDHELRRILNREPEISQVSLGPGSWILVGTDGLFDSTHYNIDPEIKAVVSLIENGADALVLVDRALGVPTGDNVTAVLVRL